MEKIKPRNKRGGVLLHLLQRINEFINNKIRNGMFGKLLSSYSRKNELFYESVTAEILGKESKFSNLLKKARFYVSEQFENSRILKQLIRIMHFFVHCKLKLYGCFMATFGIYIGLVWGIKEFIVSSVAADHTYLLYASILVLISLPMLFSKSSLSQALISSRFGCFLCVDFLGITRESLEKSQSKHGENYNIAILLGMLTGGLTYFVSPILILDIIFTFAVIAVILSYPETGILFAILSIPLSGILGDDILLPLVYVFSFSYIIKLIRGKRTMKYEITDLLTTFIGILISFGGIITISSEAYNDASNILALLFGAFVAGNLLKTKAWQQRAILTAESVGVAVALAIIVDKAFSFVQLNFDVPVINDVINFGDNNQLSVLLLIALLISLGVAGVVKSAKERFVTRLAVAIILVALIVNGSAIGAVGTFVAVLVFFIFAKQNWLSAFFFAGLLIPTGACLIPEYEARKVVAFLRHYSNMFYNNISMEHGIMNILHATYFSGVGIGGINESYPMYAKFGFENATGFSSLTTRIVSELGIIGLIIFLMFLLFMLQNCFEHMINNQNLTSRTFTIVGVSAIVTLISIGLIYDIWSSTVCFFAFWTFMTTLSAAIRSNKAESEKLVKTEAPSECSASIVL